MNLFNIAIISSSKYKQLISIVAQFVWAPST